MTGLPRLIATPERATAVLTVAMISILAVAIVVLSGPGAWLTGRSGTSPTPAAIETPAPSSPEAPPTAVPPPAADLKGLVAANAAILTDAAALQKTLDEGGTGAQLVVGLRRLNPGIGVATAAARAVPLGSPAGKIADELATVFTVISQRIADGLAVSVTDSAAYRATVSDVLVQFAAVRVLDAQLRALGGG